MLRKIERQTIAATPHAIEVVCKPLADPSR